MRTVFAFGAVLAIAAHAQQDFTFTTSNGTITITGYNGTNGVVTIPSTINGLPVTAIATHVFAFNHSLISVSIPDSVTTIGNGAFEDSSLTGVDLGKGVTSIGDYMFNNCSSLTNLVIPDSVTSLGIELCTVCTSLTNVTIGNGVTDIGAASFYVCISLNTVTLGKSVATIDNIAFESDGNLTAVYFRGNAPGANPNAFASDSCTIYYLPGTSGWGTNLAGMPTVLWNPRALPADAMFGVVSNTFGFNITGASNLTVVVEAATNLVTPDWIPLATKTLTGGSAYFSDPGWTNYPGRFYHFRQP